MREHECAKKAIWWFCLHYYFFCICGWYTLYAISGNFCLCLNINTISMCTCVLFGLCLNGKSTFQKFCSNVFLYFFSIPVCSPAQVLYVSIHLYADKQVSFFCVRTFIPFYYFCSVFFLYLFSTLIFVLPLYFHSHTLQFSHFYFFSSHHSKAFDVRALVHPRNTKMKSKSDKKTTRKTTIKHF